MEYKVRIYLLILLSTVSLGAWAKCDHKEADNGIQSAMNECAYDDFKTADSKLNVVYKKRMAILKKIQQEHPYVDSPVKLISKFKTAQLAWLKYRDAECDDEYYSFYGGSVAPMVHSSCLAKLTKDRIDEIEAKQK